MHENFTSQWDRLEALKADVLAKVEALPAALRGKAPAPDAWSPLQVAAHLAKAEAVINRYVTDFVPGEAPRPKPFLVPLLCATLRTGIPLPAPENMEPGEPGSLEDTIATWQEVRQVLHAELSDRSPDEPAAVHPLIGTMTAKQVLDANEAHLIYHLKRFPRISDHDFG